MEVAQVVRYSLKIFKSSSLLPSLNEVFRPMLHLKLMRKELNLILNHQFVFHLMEIKELIFEKRR